MAFAFTNEMYKLQKIYGAMSLRARLAGWPRGCYHACEVNWSGLARRLEVEDLHLMARAFKMKFGRFPTYREWAEGIGHWRVPDICCSRDVDVEPTRLEDFVF